VEQSGADADLGLRLGAEVLSDYEDVAVVAALHSATLGEGLHKLARYKLRVATRPGDPPPLVTDLLFAFIVSLAQRGTTKKIKPLCVELTRRRANEATLRRYFRCELR